MNLNHNDTMTSEAMEMESTTMENIRDEVGSAILDAFRRRWSPKVFSHRPVELEKLRAIFEAARWAPSSVNEQPWSFLLAGKESSEGFNALLNCLNEKNKQWAQNAPVLILSMAKMHHQRDRSANRHAWHDVGLATANLMIQATALGLYTHVMGGFSSQKAREALGIPDGFEPVAMIALGYLPEWSDSDKSSAEVIPKIRTRKPLDELVFEGRWGNPARIVDHREDREAEGAWRETFVN